MHHTRTILCYTAAGVHPQLNQGHSEWKATRGCEDIATAWSATASRQPFQLLLQPQPELVPQDYFSVSVIILTMLTSISYDTGTNQTARTLSSRIPDRNREASLLGHTSSLTSRAEHCSGTPIILWGFQVTELALGQQTTWNINIVLWWWNHGDTGKQWAWAWPCSNAQLLLTRSWKESWAVPGKWCLHKGPNLLQLGPTCQSWPLTTGLLYPLNFSSSKLPGESFVLYEQRAKFLKIPSWLVNFLMLHGWLKMQIGNWQASRFPLIDSSFSKISLSSSHRAF